jgi:Ca2+-binding RTX toxin-like protein
MGGTGADCISTVLGGTPDQTCVAQPAGTAPSAPGGNTSFVFGDDGYITWVGTELNPEGLTWAGANNDPKNIDLVASTDTWDGGNDHITIGSGRSIVVGGQGNDTITGGSGTSVILGDAGAVFAASHDTNRFGDLPITLGMVETTSPGALFGGNDTITTLDGNAIVMGGTGNDTISTGAGTNIVFGDNGYVTWVGSELNPESLVWSGSDSDPTTIDLLASTATWDGGNDTIAVGAGDAIVVGGFGDDHITGGTGSNIILGDSGAVFAAHSGAAQFGSLPITVQLAESTAPTVGGVDCITGGAGADLIIGGIGNDTIHAGEGDNLVIGDNGQFVFDTNTGGLVSAATTAPDAGGGDDKIYTGSGRDVILGGQGSDTIDAGAGDNVVFGDDGVATFDPSILVHMKSTETGADGPALGGDDTITTGPGRDVVVGGMGNDSIRAGEGDNVVFGDSAELDFTTDTSVLLQADSLAPAFGGNDTITTGAGFDVIVGGYGVDLINAGTGYNVIAGDSATMTFDANGVLHFFATTATGIGGDDQITSGLGNDVIFGGAGADTITDAGGSNIVFGDNGQVGWNTTGYTGLTATAPNDGGADMITIYGTGTNWVIGGTGGDHITTGSGDDLIFGDFAAFTGPVPTVPAVPYVPVAWQYTSIFTTVDPLIGSNDVIDAGDGRNIVVGGQGNDTITTGSGADDIVGGNNVAGDLIAGTLVAAHDGNDTITAGGGDDVIAGDNASILLNGGSTSPLDQTLTQPTIYSEPNGDGTPYLPNVTGAWAYDPTRPLQRTIVLFQGGTTAVAGSYGNDTIFGNDGNDQIFGQMGNDWIDAGNGMDYVEGGGGADVIFGGYGQDDLIGGSSDLFGYATAAQRSLDGTDVIYGDTGNATSLNDLGDQSANGHAHNADTIAGDNADIFRLVSGTQYLTFNYDNYPGATEHIVPRAVRLLDYSPTGEPYTSCNPASPADCATYVGAGNIGAADFLFGESGNDTIYGETGSDTIFGGGQDDTLIGNAGNDWISGGTGDDGILGDDGLLLLARNGVAEPLYGLAATTQTTLGADDHGDHEGDITLTVNVTGRLTYTAIEQPFFVGGNDIIYGGLGNDFLHGGAGDDAISGAEALDNFANNGNPLAYLTALGYTVTNVLGYNAATQQSKYFDPAHPFQKITVGGVDFLLNFTSALSFDPATYDPTTNAQPVLDDGQDVLFGDAGNDWLVGGTNQDVLFGGWGNDILQADDNLDSTKVTTAPTYSSICSLVTSYASDAHDAASVCHDLTQLQSQLPRMRPSDVVSSIDQIGEEIAGDIGDGWSANEAGTLVRLLQYLKPGYSALANNIADSRGNDPTFADIAYGGAGHDVLIANTASDRLIDWHDEANAYYVPWEHENEPVVIDDPNNDVAQLLLDLSLALGSDPTRPEVAPQPSWHGDGWDQLDFRNGEPFGEIGLVVAQSPNDNWWNEFGSGPYWPGEGGVNPGIDVEGTSDEAEHDESGNHDVTGSLPLIVLNTPSASTDRIEHIWHLDDEGDSLLHRFVIRGQLTAAEQAGLSSQNVWALNELIAYGLVAKVGSVWMPTSATWLALGLADAPIVTGVSSSSTTPTTPVTITGTGDATDTITIYDGTTVVPTTALVTVGTDGTWTATVYLAVGHHDLTATQTVQELPQVGLQSAKSCDFDVTSYPNPPSILPIAKPGPAAPTAVVTVSGTGVAGYSVNVYDGGKLVGTAAVDPTGAWTLSVSFAPGVHTFTATQTATVAGAKYTGAASGAASVAVYAPPAPPTVTSIVSGTVTTHAQVGGRGVAGGAVKLFEGSTLVGTATAAADGTWTAPINVLSLGKHTLTAQQLDPSSGFWGALGAGFVVTVTPDAPVVAPIAAPAAPGPIAVTVTVTGLAGYGFALYDGATKIASTTLSATGTWTVTVTLAVGVHSLTATQTSPATGPGAFTSPLGAASVVTVYAPTAAPTVTSVGTGTASTQAVVSGRGSVGGTVKLYEGSVEIGSVLVAADGTWTATLAPLAVGKHTVAAKQQDGASGFWSPLGGSFVVTINPDPPKILPITQPTAAGPVAVTVTITGTAGYAVTLYDGSTAIASTTFGAGGSWTVTVTLAAGTHSLTAKQTSPSIGGSTFTSAASAASTVTVYALPAAPYVFIAPSSVNTGTTFSITGFGIAGDTVKIYSGSVEIGSAAVASNGWWTATVAANSLALGANTLVAKQLDPASGFASTGVNLAVTRK